MSSTSQSYTLCQSLYIAAWLAIVREYLHTICCSLVSILRLLLHDGSLASEYNVAGLGRLLDHIICVARVGRVGYSNAKTHNVIQHLAAGNGRRCSLIRNDHDQSRHGVSAWQNGSNTHELVWLAVHARFGRPPMRHFFRP